MVRAGFAPQAIPKLAEGISKRRPCWVGRAYVVIVGASWPNRLVARFRRIGAALEFFLFLV